MQCNAEKYEATYWMKYENSEQQDASYAELCWAFSIKGAIKKNIKRRDTLF